MTTRDVLTLAAHPKGMPQASDYQKETQDLGELADGHVRVETQYLSVDPYLRGKMSGKTDSYFVPFTIGSPLSSLGVGKVLDSKVAEYVVGDIVTGEMEWATISDIQPNPMFRKLAPGLDAQTALSTCGLTGITAYLGLLKIGRLEEKKAGATVLVTGAAGATGNVVGQIAKLKGYRVVGIAGSDEKNAWLKDDLKFDEVINYKTDDVAAALKEKCPDGIDVYFDNVGGDIFDAAIQEMNRFGVVIHCGAISTYNATSVLQGPRLEWPIITKSLRLQGFIVTDMLPDFAAAGNELGKWASEGKIQGKVTLFDGTSGVEAIAATFIKMLEGRNTGKAIVQVK